MQKSVKNQRLIWLFAAFVLLYVGLALFLPTDPETLERFDLNQTQVRLLGLTVVIPLVGIFYAALYGFTKIRNYAYAIRNTKEGPAFGYLANGLTVLAFSLPVTSSVSSILNYVAVNNPDLLPAVTITKNYIALAFPLVAFMLLAKGANSLVHTLRTKLNEYPNFGLLSSITLSSLFTWLITTRPHTTTDEATYYLPNLLIIATLAIPYVFIWWKGAQAASHLFSYHRLVKGTVYKDALKYIALGVGGIIAISILMQILTTLSARLDRLSLTPILLLVYFLVALYAVGYGLVARGAKKLKQIEEV